MKGVSNGLAPYGQVANGYAEQLNIPMNGSSYKHNVLYPASAKTRGTITSTQGTQDYINTAVKFT